MILTKSGPTILITRGLSITNAGDTCIVSFVKYSIEKYQRNAILTDIFTV